MLHIHILSYVSYGGKGSLKQLVFELLHFRLFEFYIFWFLKFKPLVAISYEYLGHRKLLKDSIEENRNRTTRSIGLHQNTKTKCIDYIMRDRNTTLIRLIKEERLPQKRSVGPRQNSRMKDLRRLCYLSSADLFWAIVPKI